VVGCQPYAPAAFTPRKYSWYSFLLEAGSTPGLYCDPKDFMSTKSPLTPAGIEPATFRFVAQHPNHCATAVPPVSYVQKDITCTSEINSTFHLHSSCSQTHHSVHRSSLTCNNRKQLLMDFTMNILTLENPVIYVPPGIRFSTPTFCPHSVFKCFVCI